MSRRGLRAARVTTLDHCAFGVISAQDFRECLLKIEKQTKEKLIEFIKKLPQFNTLSKGAVSKIVNSLN